LALAPKKLNTARDSAPDSIRALFGTDGSKNAVHGSDSLISSTREIELIFGMKYQSLEDQPFLAPAFAPIETSDLVEPDTPATLYEHAVEQLDSDENLEPLSESLSEVFVSADSQIEVDPDYSEGKYFT
jgi:hypothetical protein